MTAVAGGAAVGSAETLAAVRAVRLGRARRNRIACTVLASLIVVAFALSLVVGQDAYSPLDALRVVLGQQVEGASFAVGRLRLPKAILGLLVGAAFGLAGVTFQTMLRNPLAAPDVIGISAGASAAAAFGIVTLSLSAREVSLLAIVAGLVVALAIFALASRGGVLGARLILIGIGVGAMLDSLTTWVLQGASRWDLQEALRWLSGSLNGARWESVLLVLLAMLALAPVLLALGKDLEATRLGDDAASALGVRVSRVRLLLVVAAVGLIGFATAATGPIAFVAFLAGPIAARIVRPGGSLLLPAALVGSLLVLVAAIVGEHVLPRFPVGVVTGVLGAPYLLYLIVRSNRTGAAS